MDYIAKLLSEFPGTTEFKAEDLLFSFQDGQSCKLAGAVLQEFCRAAVDELVKRAETAAGDAEAAKNAIAALEVAANTLETGELATAAVELTEDKFLITFGLPRGDKGAPGASILSIDRTAGTGAAGTVDTYTVTLTDGSKTTFQVYNGKDGSGAGDMVASVYDPQGKATDIFKYVDDAVEKGGGTGGMYANIFVIGLSASDTVSASNGSEIKNAVWNSAKNRHEITKIGNVGIWTIVATNGEQTTTQNVLVDGALDYEIEMFYGIYTEFDEKETDWIEEGGAFNYGSGLYIERDTPLGTSSIVSGAVGRDLVIPLDFGKKFTIEFSDCITTAVNKDMGGIWLRAFDENGNRTLMIAHYDGWAGTAGQLCRITTDGTEHLAIPESNLSGVTLDCKYVCEGSAFEFYVNDELKASGTATEGNLAKLHIAIGGYSGYTQPAVRVDYLRVTNGVTV